MGEWRATCKSNSSVHGHMRTAPNRAREGQHGAASRHAYKSDMMAAAGSRCEAVVADTTTAEAWDGAGGNSSDFAAKRAGQQGMGSMARCGRPRPGLGGPIDPAWRHRVTT